MEAAEWETLRERADSKADAAKKNTSRGGPEMTLAFALDALRLELRAAVDRIIDHDVTSRVEVELADDSPGE